jgi:alkanesulfonate monooxygenase
VREVAEHVAIGGIGPVVIGTPAQVADALEAWIEATDVDGFNMCFALAPETFADIADLLVPELQRRGRYKRDYAGGTLREKLFGEGARPKRSHPAFRYNLSAVASAAE